MTEQTTQTIVDQGVSATSNVAPTSTATPAAPHIQTQQQLQQQQQNQAFMQQFWNRQITIAEQFESDFKNHPLPLARIKKVMKSDQDVKMISAEAPILFSKACEIFISEITIRAWTHAEENKRRTLQRSDVASAVSRSDQFDFLIDIVPREEVPKSSNRRPKEEPQAEHMYAEQNVLAYYQPGIPYTPDPSATSYYQQLHTEHMNHEMQLQEQLRQQHRQFAERERQQSLTSSGTTSQAVVTQQQQQQQQEQTQTLQQQRSTQQSTPQDQNQTSQKTSAPPSTTPSDGSVIDEQQIQAAVNMLSANVVHTKQEPEDQDKQRSKSTRKGSKKTKK